MGSMNWANVLAAFGGAAMIPIFTGGAKTANLRLKKNYYEQTLQNYYKTNLTAIQEVNNALCALKFDHDKYIKNLNSYNMQKQEYKFSEVKYHDGLISNLDLLQQKETLLTMNKMVVNSKTDCYINQISLYKAVGGAL
ncbi:Antibiotic efflux pump outer membrane protein ArpC [bioreactor metagenome]|uniref:Antibiotic efflux pump outer membrane protein ArpC n=1 Tax=bioreactor metagenome TaxID=1076179 RepID=A0A645HZ07_9ZZZZ